MPKSMFWSNWQKQIVMELEHWFTILAEDLPLELKWMPGGVPQQFFDWMHAD